MAIGRAQLGWDGASAPERRRQRIFAGLLVVFAHLLILVSFLSSHRIGGMIGGRASGQGDESAGQGQVISMVLVDLRSSHAKASTSQTQDPLDAVMRQALKASANASDQPATAPARRSTSLDALLAAADRSLRPQGKSNPASSAAVSGSAGSKGVAGATSSGSSRQSGDLWPQVEPCWRQAIQASRAPVVLEVSLNDAGRLSGAPRVIPGAGSGDPQALRVSVERALQAVAACMPYRIGGRVAERGVYRIGFGVSAPVQGP